MPVETAVHRYDPVVFLLVGLGASPNIGIRQSYERTWTKGASLLDAVGALVEKIDEDLKNSKQPTGSEGMEVTSADQPEWKTWLTKSNKAVKDFQEKVNKVQQDSKHISLRNRMKDYLEEVRAVLREKKAKTWNELHPDTEKKGKGDGAVKQQIQVTPFHVWTSDWWDSPVSQEKVPLYEELYEACWNGDDEKIRELCLSSPEGITRKAAPIQIVCKTIEGGTLRLCLMLSLNTHTPFVEFTPLHVAIHRRHWSTVNAILTIAAAQQKTKSEAAHTTVFSTFNIKLGRLAPFFLIWTSLITPPLIDDSDEEGSDAEETDDGSGDDSDDKEEPEFIDLDRQDTQARFDVGPEKLLKTRIARLPETEDGLVSHVNPLEGAIYDGDFEAFIQIAEINAKLPKPIALTDLASEDTILQTDRAKLLDEYIRRTGQGIEVPQKNETTGDVPQRPKGKEYWGLNVHGKKRRDLASKGDPNFRYKTASKIPLVWSAAKHGALGVLEYLNSDRPLAAYQYYFSANAKESKEADLSVLESSISELLGWCSNPSNETPLNAAVQLGKLDTFKKLLELNPTLLKPYLHKRYIT